MQDSYSAKLSVVVRFDEPDCECCEYRQWIKRKVGYRAVATDGTLEPFQWLEDEETYRVDRTPSGKYAGWRGNPEPLESEQYSDCGYIYFDYPGLVKVRERVVPTVLRICERNPGLGAVEFRFVLWFKGYIVDNCQGLFTDDPPDGYLFVDDVLERWSVDCTLRVDCDGSFAGTDRDEEPILPPMAS